MASRNAVQRAFDAYGKTNFTTKKSGTWWRTRGEVTQCVNLQKSQYSLRYYVNVRLGLLPGGEGARVEGRAEALLGARDAAGLERLLDIDGSDMVEEHREAELLALLDRLSAVLDKLDSVEAVATAERHGALARMGIRGPARALLDSTP